MLDHRNRMATVYDTILYPTHADPKTHPDRLATLGTLFGMEPPSVEKCRLLEIGCGDASNLIAMACALPESKFVGIDLATRPIEIGRKMADDLGLKNIALHTLDLQDLDDACGTFDYITAHGVYSWVPAEVRDALLARIQARLAPHGIAYVSYNLYPGGYVFRMFREMMLFHTREIEEPAKRAQQARAFLHFLLEAQPEDSTYRQMIQDFLDRFAGAPDAFLLHDVLAGIYESFSLIDFADHAARHDLQYLADADYFSMQVRKFPEATMAVLRQLDSTPLVQEQYLDFVVQRSFRRSLLCHDEVPMQRRQAPEQMPAFLFSAPIREATPETNEDLPLFKGVRGQIRTSHAMTQAVCRHLGEVWPYRVSFDELLEIARAHHDGDTAELLGAMLLNFYADGFIHLHRIEAPLVADVSAQPEASALARLQARHSDTVTTMLHTTLKLNNDTHRRLLLLLDGTRDHEMLLTAMNAEINGEADASLFTEEDLAVILHRFARHGVLIA